MAFENYQCDNCGECCKQLIVESDYLDAMREPRLYELSPDIDRAKFRAGERCIVLYDTETRQCPFLTPECKCGIYPTRPNECVAVEPGDAKCQQSRVMAGLPLLRDKEGELPSRELLEWSCENYSLDFDDWFVLQGVEE